MRMVMMMVAVAFLAAPFTGCGQPSDELKQVGTKIGETWDAVKTYSIKKKDEAVGLFNKGIEDITPAYETAKEKAAALGGDAAEVLDKEWDVVKQKLEEAQNATAENWDSARDAFVKAYGDFKKKITD